MRDTIDVDDTDFDIVSGAERNNNMLTINIPDRASQDKSVNNIGLELLTMCRIVNAVIVNGRAGVDYGIE